MVQPAEQFPRIAKYDLLDELGHGGMATVYRALDRRLGREVAVKVIHRHLRESGEVARRFTSEARAVAKLKHPNIVEIYDVSDEDVPERYLVAELVRGLSLRAHLTQHPAMPPEVAACLGVELASALAHAHERGVIHRDVKPENILFSLPWADTGEASEPTLACVKLTDFGIAKLLDQQGVTSTGQVLGSPAYMAPEQIDGDGDVVDPRADVFSLGVVIYECMVGRLPFDGKTPGQILKAILHGHYAPADQENPAVGARWSRVVHEALAPDAQQRFASMIALKAALEAELRSLGFTDTKHELTAYLRDPDAYRAAHHERVLVLLREQGRKALRAGDTFAAAATINRAAAMAPGDPEIMAQVQALVRAGSLDRWRGRALAAAGAVAASAALGALGWYGLRLPPPTRARALDPILWPLPSAAAPAASSGGPPPAPPAASSVAGHKLAVPSVGPRASSDPPGDFRSVILTRHPVSADWYLDAAPLNEYQSTTQPIEMRVGSKHVLFARIMAGNNCCVETEISVPFTVEPAPPGPMAIPKRVSVSFRMRPALVESRGPITLTFQCLGLSGELYKVNGLHSFPMKDVSQTVTCDLMEGGKPSRPQRVTVLAGETTRISW